MQHQHSHRIKQTTFISVAGALDQHSFIIQKDYFNFTVMKKCFAVLNVKGLSPNSLNVIMTLKGGRGKVDDANSFQAMQTTSINCIKHDVKVRGVGDYMLSVTMTLREFGDSYLVCS